MDRGHRIGGCCLRDSYNAKSRLRLSTDERNISARRNCCLVCSRLESTARYLGIKIDDALEMAEQTEV